MGRGWNAAAHLVIVYPIPRGLAKKFFKFSYSHVPVQQPAAGPLWSSGEPPSPISPGEPPNAPPKWWYCFRHSALQNLCGGL